MVLLLPQTILLLSVRLSRSKDQHQLCSHHAGHYCLLWVFSCDVYLHPPSCCSVTQSRHCAWNVSCVSELLDQHEADGDQANQTPCCALFELSRCSSTSRAKHWGRIPTTGLLQPACCYCRGHVRGCVLYIQLLEVSSRGAFCHDSSSWMVHGVSIPHQHVAAHPRILFLIRKADCGHPCASGRLSWLQPDHIDSGTAADWTHSLVCVSSIVAQRLLWYRSLHTLH